MKNKIDESLLKLSTQDYCTTPGNGFDCPAPDLQDVPVPRKPGWVSHKWVCLIFKADLVPLAHTLGRCKECRDRHPEGVAIGGAKK